jgi:tripartite-type tricarboxylate transporter receptor subunit TctC
MRILLAVLAFLAAGSASAQYPTKPLRLIVPFAPGGSTDIFARLIAERAQGPLGQPVVVENKAGAAGNIGANEVAKGATDGYTLLMATTGVMAINNALYKNMTYDAAKDLEPVLYVASITNVLIVPPDLPARNVAELIAMAKKDPGKLAFASSGAGASTHMSAELFKAMSGTDILHVPYKGSGPAMPDLMAGRVQMMFENAPGAVGHIKAGKLRALGVTGLKPSSALPGVPPVAETVPGYESLSWSGIAVAAGTPKNIVEKLNRDLNTVLAMPEMRQKIEEQGAEVIGGPPEAFARHIAAEREKWTRVIRTANIVVN